MSAGLKPLLLHEAPLLLQHEYLPMEAGYALNDDGMWHIAASTYMLNCSGPMLDWWFSHIQNTQTYKLWHPRDHVFSGWEGPRDTGSYIGGHHLVKEYIGGELANLKISFKSPAEYFGASWKEDFARAGYSTAVCGRVGMWEPEQNTVNYTGHLIHLIKDEPDGCRMRSRFWLGDIEGLTTPEERMRLPLAPLAKGLCKHATEEMAILAKILPDMYRTYGTSRGNGKL